MLCTETQNSALNQSDETMLVKMGSGDVAGLLLCELSVCTVV